MGFEFNGEVPQSTGQTSTLTAADVLPGPQQSKLVAKPAGTTEGGGNGGSGGGNGGTEGGGTGDTNTNNNKNVNKNINNNKSISNSSAFSFGGVGGGFCTENWGGGASVFGIGGGAEHSKVNFNCLNQLQTQERFKWTLDSKQFTDQLNFNFKQETDANANAKAANANTDRKTSCEAAANLANAATSQYGEIVVAGQQTKTNPYASPVADSLSKSAVYLAGKSLVAADACVPNSPPPIEIPAITAVTITTVEAPKPPAPHAPAHPVHHIVHKAAGPCTTADAPHKK